MIKRCVSWYSIEKSSSPSENEADNQEEKKEIKEMLKALMGLNPMEKELLHRYTLNMRTSNQSSMTLLEAGMLLGYRISTHTDQAGNLVATLMMGDTRYGSEVVRGDENE